ncbi:MAG: translocation/assembly module TamB domain-containing protein [Sphingobium sp.]
MAEDGGIDPVTTGPAEENAVRVRRRWLRLRHWLAMAVLGLILALAAFLSWLDGPAGHRFVIAQIAGLKPESGLRIAIGRIDGSLYRRASFHDVSLSDPHGVFFSSPEIRLVWSPLGWLSNRLDIDELILPKARLHKLPQLKSTGGGKILPDFDIRIMRLRVDQLAVDKAVTGRTDSFTLEGDGDVRGGQAIIDLSARSLKGDDRLLLALDSRPDDNRFDVDLTVNARAGGLIATLAGLRQDANVRLEGKGDWARWDGKLIATLDRKSAAGFDLGLRKGDWTLEGTVAGAAIASEGVLARLTSPQLKLSARGRYANKLLSGDLRAESDALAVSMKGGVHLGGHGYDNLLIDVGVNKPGALLKSFDARGLVARMRLNGPFSTARFEYLLRADRLRFGDTMLSTVCAAGDGRAGGKSGVTLIPVDLTAQKIDGQGDLVASILRNARLTGTLQKKGDIITSTPMRLRSDKLDSEVLALFDLGSGRYDLALAGDLRGLLIPGFGIIDVHSRVKAKPDGQGRFSLTGQVDAGMRRFDIAFLKQIAGGLPHVRSDIMLGPDGRLYLKGTSLRSPLLALDGEGVRNRDGSIAFSGKGHHGDYGPLELTLSGALELPAVDLLLKRPLDAAGLADVHVLLDPQGHDYRLKADGQSLLGPFAGEGMIEMPPGGETVIAVDRLTVNGAEGKGRLRAVTGGLAGRLEFDGSLRGPVDLMVDNAVQKAKVDFRINQAHFAAATPIIIGRGRLQAGLALDPAGTAIDGNLRAFSVQVGGLRINRVSAETKLVGGTGKLKGNIVGQRGRLFDLQADADIAPDAIGIALSGSLDRQAISLDRKARLTRVEGGWALAPVAIRYRGGLAVINSASFGSDVRLDVGLKNLSLSLLDLSNNDLGLGGTASGRVSYGWSRADGASGSASLRVKGLTRSGVTRTSAPVDLGLNAELTDQRLAMRALVRQDGTIIGKAQALMSPLGEGSLMERLQAAPVRAQIRYVGPASSLWRMSTIEIVDLSGQVAITANIRGTGANPVIDGALMTRDAVLESPITGMRLTNVRSAARFNGSRLVFSSISASSGSGGTITGRGSFDLSLGEGVGMDLSFQTDKAVLLDRDDIGATVTGPVRIQSNGVGGLISGDFDVIRSRFTMGKAAAVAEIPELRVIEKNRRGGDFEQPQRGADWRLAIKADARNRLMVSGMGLTSEWGMNLDVGGTVVAPKIVGRADLVRGTYDFAGRRFDLSEGALRFDGSVPADPTLDITAEASLTDLDATIAIKGTSLAPEITFSSTPSLPQDEVLSRILFGSSITNLSAPEALQLAAAVGSLQGGGGGGLDPINAVRKAAGLDRLRILPADATTGQGTSIGVGKYLTRKIYTELITDGQGYSATRLEYQVTRWLSLLSSVSTLGRQSVTVRASKDY